MDAQQEQSLLALLEWEERRDRWLAVPEADRVRLVETLARVMIRIADRGVGNEHSEDHLRSS